MRKLFERTYRTTLIPGLRRQVEEWIGYPLPTQQEEEACPAWADTKYEEAVTALREATRDTSRFPLVFAENANYGFRRNLWGLRPIGTTIAVLLVLTCWTLLLLPPPHPAGRRPLAPLALVAK